MTTRNLKPDNPGYTQEDWDEVSDNPEWTADDFAKARPFREVLPELYASWKQSRETDRVPAKQDVLVRLDSDVIEHFKSSGPDWETRMNDALRAFIVGHPL